MSEILTGDCLTSMKTMPSDSVDLVCTDPPYGYSFMGKDWDKAVPSVDVWKECLRVMKPGAFAFVMSAPRQDVLSQMIVRLGEAGFDMSFSSIYWTYSSGFPKAHNIGKAVDKMKGVESKVIGKDSRTAKRENTVSLPSIGFGEWDITAPATPEAKALEGSYGGFQPKPAVEIIIVCMKPMTEKTFASQALANGKGITWLDDCRIPYASDGDKDGAEWGTKGSADGWGLKEGAEVMPTNTKGRFPANLLVSDNVLDNGVVSKSSKFPEGYAQGIGNAKNTYDGRNMSKYVITNESGYNDKGQYSRYFSLDKWAEVNGISDENNTFPFLICTKASKKEKNAGCEALKVGSCSEFPNQGARSSGDPDRTYAQHHNTHPTVKSLKLMSYLITLGSREGDIVLDPFAGSGTTLVAAKQLKRNYIGCELSPEYVEIIEARLNIKQKPISSVPIIMKIKEHDFFG